MVKLKHKQNENSKENQFIQVELRINWAKNSNN